MKSRFLFTTRIDLDDEFYIVLREPTATELGYFERQEEMYATLLKLFPVCITDHNLTDDQGKQLSAKAAAEEVMESGTTYKKAVDVWMQSLPLGSGRDGK